MALWMEEGAEALTERERADLDAIDALKESAALEFKEKGNRFVKMGKKHHSDAIDCYTRAINQNILSDSESSILFSNRAHVNLLLGNYRRALSDAEEAIKLSSINIKDLASAIESRGIKLGKPIYQDLTGIRKPVCDNNNILHWPVLLLYAEVMSSDFIEDFCETDMFSTHLDMMFSESSLPLPWDTEHAYTREAIELYYESGAGIKLSKGQVLQHLLEGTAGSLVAESIYDEDHDTDNHLNQSSDKRSLKWIKVNQKKTLYEVLRQPDYIIPGIPVFYIVSKQSAFYKEFRAGKWAPP